MPPFLVCYKIEMVLSYYWLNELNGSRSALISHSDTPKHFLIYAYWFPFPKSSFKDFFTFQQKYLVVLKQKIIWKQNGFLQHGRHAASVYLGEFTGTEVAQTLPN